MKKAHLTLPALALLCACGGLELPFGIPANRRDCQRPMQELSRSDALALSSCHLHTERGLLHRSYGSSATLLNDGWLLTAGHNLRRKLIKVRRIIVRCGETNVNDDTAAQLTFTMEGGTLDAAVRLFGPGSNYRNDIALLRVPMESLSTSEQEWIEDYGQELTHTFSLSEGEVVQLRGYPAEDGSPVRDGNTLHRASATVAEVAEAAFSYRLWTFGGNSGGGVWVERPGAAADEPPVWKLVGVHIAPSAARRIDDAFIDFLQTQRASVR